MTRSAQRAGSRRTGGATDGPAAPADVRVVSPDGAVFRQPLSAAQQIAMYSELVHAGDGLVELVAATRAADGSLRMRRRDDPRNYLPAGDGRALAELARRHAATGHELFASVLPRTRPEPGKQAVERGCVVWVDLDDVDAGEGLARVGALRPHLALASGRGLHGYWRLVEEIDAAAVESLNRRLAHRLGGDMSCTDRGRIMRLPGSFNGKRGASSRILAADFGRPLVDPGEVRRALPDPEPRRERARPPRVRLLEDDELGRVPPPGYFRLLCGVAVPSRGGYVLCPLHEERTPSCMVWAEPARGWWCFGCGRGGGIYDLASLMDGGPWGRELAGESFIAVRDRLRKRTGVRDEGQTPGRRQVARRPRWATSERHPAAAANLQEPRRRYGPRAADERRVTLPPPGYLMMLASQWTRYSSSWRSIRKSTEA